MISEDLDELLALSDRIAVVFSGEVLGVVPARGCDRNEICLIMACVRGGETSIDENVAAVVPGRATAAKT